MYTTGKTNYKHSQIESNIQNILNLTLRQIINNDVLKHVSITYVKMSKDGSHLSVYIDTYDRSKMDKIIKALETAKGVFRKELAMRMNKYKVPKVFFKPDITIEESFKIEQLLSKIKNKNNG